MTKGDHIYTMALRGKSVPLVTYTSRPLILTDPDEIPKIFIIRPNEMYKMWVEISCVEVSCVD